MNLNDVPKFKKLFYDDRLTIDEVAKYFNVTFSTVSNFRVNHNLPVRGWSKPPWLGKKRSKDTCDKISKSQIGKRRGKLSYNWKGGRFFNGSGYIIAQVFGNFSNYRGYALEHRYIMEKHLGRKLLKRERVHHINGIKDDNRLENLKLFDSNSSHSKYHVPKGSYIGSNCNRNHA